MHFVLKDFKVHKSSGSFDTSMEDIGKGEQPLPPTTARQTTRPGLFVIIPLSLLEHTPSARGSPSTAPTNLPLLVLDSDSIE